MFNIQAQQVCSEHIASTITKKKNLFISDTELANKWAVGESTDEQTVKAMTQNFIRCALNPIERRFRTKHNAKIQSTQVYLLFRYFLF